ncbi:mucin-2 isoform X2 [Ixodes scapularis]
MQDSVQKSPPKSNKDLTERSKATKEDSTSVLSSPAPVFAGTEAPPGEPRQIELPERPVEDKPTSTSSELLPGEPASTPIGPVQYPLTGPPPASPSYYGGQPGYVSVPEQPSFLFGDAGIKDTSTPTGESGTQNSGPSNGFPSTYERFPGTPLGTANSALNPNFIPQVDTSPGPAAEVGQGGEDNAGPSFTQDVSSHGGSTLPGSDGFHLPTADTQGAPDETLQPQYYGGPSSFGVFEWSTNWHRTDNFMACDHPTIGPRAPGRTANNNSISDRSANDHEVTDGKFDNCTANDHREETSTTPKSVSTTPEMSTPQDTSVTTSNVLFRPGPSLVEEEHTTQADTVSEPPVGETTTAGALDLLTTVGHSASRSPKQLTHPFTSSPDQTTEAVTTATVTDVVSDAAFTTVTPLDAVTISESGEQETTSTGDLFTSLFPEVSTRVRAAMTTEATTNTAHVVDLSDNSIETETDATITAKVSCRIESRNLTVPCLLPQELNNTVTVKFSEWDHGRTESFREEVKRRLADYCLRKGIPLGATTIVFVANEHGMDLISFFVMNHTRGKEGRPRSVESISASCNPCVKCGPQD